MFTWKPVGEGSKVGAWGNLSLLKGSDSSSRQVNDAETSWNTNCLLGSSQDTVKTPLIESNLLTSNRANAIDNDQSLWRNLTHNLRDGLNVVEDASAGIGVGNGDGLVFLLLQCLFDLLVGWAGSDTGGVLELSWDSSVGSNARCE